MNRPDVPIEVVQPTEVSSTGWERTHQILLLGMLVLVVSTQICWESGTERTARDLADMPLSVHCAEVFTAQVSGHSDDPYLRVTYRCAILLLEILLQPISRQATLPTDASVLGLISAGNVSDKIVTRTKANPKM